LSYFHSHTFGVRSTVLPGCENGDPHLAHLESFRYLKGPNCSFASTQEEKTAHVSCYFKGDLTQKRINEIHIDRHLHDEDDCHKVIHMYVNASTVHNGFSTTDFCFTSLLSDELKKVHGPYAFVLYDKFHKRVVAARDPDGKEPLFWASKQTDDTLSLYFSTDRLALYESADSIAEFPVGGLYISESGKLCGSINGKPFVSTKETKKGAKGRKGSTTGAAQRTTGKAGHAPSRAVPLGGFAATKTQPPKPRINKESATESTRFGKSEAPNLRHKASPKELVPAATEPPRSPFDRKRIDRARHILVEE